MAPKKKFTLRQQITRLRFACRSLKEQLDRAVAERDIAVRALADSRHENGTLANAKAYLMGELDKVTTRVRDLQSVRVPNGNAYRCIGGPAHGQEFSLQSNHFEVCVPEQQTMTPFRYDHIPPYIRPRIHRYCVRRVYLAGYAVGKFLVHESLWKSGDGRDYMGVER
jgi:hypothetical protein